MCQRLHSSQNIKTMPQIDRCSSAHTFYKATTVFQSFHVHHTTKICFTETWLDATIPDSAVQPPGVTIYRSDRSHDETGKARGWGVYILLNDRWATDVKIMSKMCYC